jgi:LPXTG-site transpeptidase (sortase) family protein
VAAVSRAFALVARVTAVGVLAVAGCSASDGTPAAPGGAEGPPGPEATSPPPPGEGSSVAEAIVPLPPAAPLPQVPDLPEPTTLDVGALGVRAAPVVPVGVNPEGDMEVPGVREVGWYEFGPRPGDPGSAVLAAHIAYDGVDGVFRHLDDLAPGDTIIVRFADGTARTFAVTELAQYDKSALPADLWSREGPDRLVLITCGGEFDDATDSYEDNVVAYASPA